MKTTIPVRILSNMIAWARSVSPTGAEKTLLKNIFVRMNYDELFLSSADGEAMDITVSYPVSGHGPAVSFGVSAENIEAFVGVLPKDADVVLDGDGSSLVLTCGKSRSKLPAIDPDFFSPSDVDYKNTFHIPSPLFREAIMDVEACAARPSKDSFGGAAFEVVKIVGDGDSVRFAATDGLKIGYRGITVPDARFSFDIVVPVRTVSKMTQIMDSAAEIDIMISDKRLALAGIVDSEITVFFTSLLGAEPEKFPSVWKGFSPEGREFKVVLEISKSELIDKLLRPVALVSEKTSGRGALFTLDANESELSAKITGQVGEANTSIPVAIVKAGEGLVLSFGARPVFMSSATRRIRTERVRLMMTGEKDPMFVCPTNAEDMWYVVMLVHASSAG